MWTKAKSIGEFERWSAKYDELLAYLQDNEFDLDYYRSEWPFKHILSNVFTSFFFSFDQICCICEMLLLNCNENKEIVYIMISTNDFGVNEVGYILFW